MTHPLSAPIPSRASAANRWGSYLFDHILPAIMYSYAAIGNGLLVVEVAAGQGPAVGLDPLEQSGLLIQRAIVTLFVSLIAALFMIRRPRADGRPGLVTALLVSITRADRRGRQQVASELVPALVAIAGTNALFLQGIAPVTHTSALLTIPGAALGLLGICFAIWSLASLGRCFGIFPEVRGLVTRGPYKRIRHPLYLAEIISAFGGLLSTLSLSTVPLFALFVGLQYWRAMNEERVLGQTFPEYADYQQRTWRILPGLH